ncbi:MAG: ATP phosphoribosyltransferase regulatory subunit, partial [Acidobacteriota bacterium]
MRVSEALPTGVTALLFDTARHRRQLEAQLVALLEAREHHEVVLPVIDYLDPYRALMNDARRGELYPLIDRDGEVLTLRADFTPMLARLIAPRLASLDLPLRLFYRGDVLRYQEERAGRQREFYQVGAELLGLDGADAEREALHTFADLLDAVRDGLDARIVIGAAGALDALLAGHGGDDPQALAAAVVRREQGVARDAAPA